jgi:hypothetical protein
MKRIALFGMAATFFSSFFKFLFVLHFGGLWRTEGIIVNRRALATETFFFLVAVL